MPASAQLRWTVWVSVVTATTQHLLLNMARGGGRWGLARQFQHQLTLWVCVRCCADCHLLLAETLPSYRPLLSLLDKVLYTAAHWPTKSHRTMPPLPHGVIDRPMAIVNPHQCQIASTVAYLGSWSTVLHQVAPLIAIVQSAVDDATIIDRFVKWSRQDVLCPNHIIKISAFVMSNSK